MPSRKTTHLINVLCIAALITCSVVAWFHPYFWETFGIKVIHPEGFEDTRVITAGIESERLGFDAQVNNVCDPWQRGMNYPRVWILLGRVGLGPEHTRVLGMTFGSIFLLGVLALCATRESQSFPLAILALAPAVLLGVERGNNDLVIFGGLCSALLMAKRFPNGAALVWLLLCAIKLYPILAAPAFIGTTRRRTIIACVIALGCYLILIRDQLPAITAHTPAFSLSSFGSRTILRYWDRYLMPGREFIWALSVALATLPFFFVRPTHCLGHVGSLPTRLFLAGGSITCLGYLVFNSFDYRLIFCILCVPHLASEWLRDGSSRHLAALACIAASMTMVATETALYRAGIQPVDFIPFTQAMRWMMFLALAPLVIEQLFAATGRTLDKFLHPEEHA